MNPIDQTTFGFSSAGFAPLPSESASFAQQRHMATRAADYMQFIDPYIERTVMAAARLAAREGANQAEIRRAAYGSTGGQAFLDVAMLLRQQGLLGSGNPINYGMNIMQGVQGGGFGIDIFSGIRRVGYNNLIQGGGFLAEQMSAQFMKGLMRDLYGHGAPDPSKLYGLNMEEASGIFRRLAQRAGLGRMGILQQNATFAERVAAARQNEGDALLLDSLSGLTEGNIDSRIEAATDQKVRQFLTDLKKPGAAMLFDTEARRKISETVRETARGLANLKDIYGELTDDQLDSVMRQITGLSLTSSQQARQANAIINNLRSAANASGMDPRALMDSLGANNPGMATMLDSRWAGMFGMDARHATATSRLRGSMEVSIASSAMGAAALNRFATATLSGMGLNTTAVDAAEMREDVSRQVGTMATQHPAMFHAEGLASGQFSNDPSFRAQVESLKARYRAVRTPEERAAIEREARRLISSRTNLDYSTWARSRGAQMALGDIDFMGGRDLAELALSGATSQVSRSVVSTQMLQRSFGASAEDAVIARDAIIRGIGVGGLSEMLLADGTSADRDQIEAVLARAGLSDSQASAFRRVMLGSDGRMRTGSALNNLLTDLQRSSASGLSFYDIRHGRQREMEQASLAARTALSDKDGLSLKSIVNSLITGKVEGLTSDAHYMAALEVLEDQGLDIGVGRLGVADFRDGISRTEMDAIRAASGNDYAYHTRLGYSSEDEMLAATANDPVARARLMDLIQTVSGLVFDGPVDRMKFISSDALAKARSIDLDKRARAAGALRRSSGLTVGEVNSAMIEIMKTGRTDKAGLVLAADSSEEKGIFNRYVSDENGNRIMRMDNANLWNLRAGLMDNESDLGGLVALDQLSGGAVVEGMQKQLEAFVTAQKYAVNKIETWDEAGNKTYLDLNKEFIESFKERLDKFIEAVEMSGGSSGDEEVSKHMTVQTMEVINMVPPK